MTTPSDIFAAPTPTPAEAALKSAVAVADELIRLVRYHIDGISIRSRLVGWSAIVASDPTVAGVAVAYYDAITQVLPGVDPSAILPPLYELTPAFITSGGDPAEVTRAVADVLACTREIYRSIGSAMQRWSDLSASVGWTAIQSAGDASRVDALIAAITAMWPGMSAVAMPVIHADPVPPPTLPGTETTP